MDLQSGVKLAANLKLLPADENGKPKLGFAFIAMFNPETIAISEDINWKFHDVSGTQGQSVEWVNTKYRKFNIDIMLDGTGVSTNGIKVPVTAQIALFRKTTTSVEGADHKPNHLILQFGIFIVHCVLSSSTVTYTMFDAAGLPIRAKISASFAEVTQQGLMKRLAMLSSPDLTHKVTIKEGDLLPLLTYNIYKNQDYYLQLAKVNKLKNFRKLIAGTEITAPPIAKT
ncbi:MAG TPA: hypothetical protein VF144_17470 [Chitinophagaceae bacterium]